eukprot:Protomagalhaensia_sp_Gyna_25__1543@NODE_1795_length_1533_cov_762_233601_g722_i1_p1_GENE_NODE_1795_length_1533_cov_762_233601_g722_i1NODE_1795_length_1533_cov_762_233601_g722_i1_p1_ORF_typecomplete_len126_score5_60_NODE_1795_length_1533_cov_762_233601_g722_i17671144
MMRPFLQTAESLPSANIRGTTHAAKALCFLSQSSEIHDKSIIHYFAPELNLNAIGVSVKGLFDEFPGAVSSRANGSLHNKVGTFKVEVVASNAYTAGTRSAQLVGLGWRHSIYFSRTLSGFQCTA